MDSSSIAKLYVDEDKALETRQVLQVADRVASTAIAYVEVKAALARRRRERRIRTAKAFEEVSADFDSDWPSLLAISPTEAVIKSAAALVTSHPLSGYDAVHLASALELRNLTPEEIRFSTWDTQLSRAARAEGLSLAHEVSQ